MVKRILTVGAVVIIAVSATTGLTVAQAIAVEPGNGCAVCWP